MACLYYEKKRKDGILRHLVLRLCIECIISGFIFPILIDEEEVLDISSDKCVGALSLVIAQYADRIVVVDKGSIVFYNTG